MKQILLFTLSLFFILNFASAQTGCPGCVINLPTLPEDTLFLSQVASGVAGQPYESNVSFRLPKTTTPVYALDSMTTPGLDIDQLVIQSIENLPPGLGWEANQNIYTPATITDGCIKFCGTPTQFGIYEVLVTIDASISIVTQTASFPISIEIVAPSNANEGFSMINTLGCGESEVSFFNNTPSNGIQGYSYTWDFGNGSTSFDENPASLIYNEPGIYYVDYTATVDTTGFILTNASVNSVSCTDLFGTPDMFIRLFDPNGVQIYESEVIENTNAPVSFPLDLLVGEGNYEIQVWDLDDGIFGGEDDLCGSISFNQLSNGPISSGDFSVNFSIIHPVSTIEERDSVIIFALPEMPAIGPNSLNTACEGDAIVLYSSYSIRNQWFRDGELMPGENADSLLVDEAGSYQVQYSTLEGCTAMSEEVQTDFIGLPIAPFFNNDNNFLFLIDSDFLPMDYVLQWYLNGEAIDGETGFELCAIESGEYALVVTDLETNCQKDYTQDVSINGDFDCTVPVYEVEKGLDINVYPNPTLGPIAIEFSEKVEWKSPLRIMNSTGSIIKEIDLENSNGKLQLDMSEEARGIYFLYFEIEGNVFARRIILN